MLRYVRKGLGLGAAIVATSAFAFVGAAAAATPEQIYADAADNGRLDRSYSAADLARYRHDATVAGYGNKIVSVVVKPKLTIKAKPKVTPKPKVKTAVKTVSTRVVAAPKKRPRQVFTPPRSALPFTGSELGTFLALGIALVAGGFLLRMMTGRRTRSR